MKEFNKIYCAKYYENLGSGVLARDLGYNKSEIEKIIKQLKEEGLYDIYKNLSDDEWDKLEKKSDDFIRNKYLGNDNKLEVEKEIKIIIPKKKNENKPTSKSLAHQYKVWKEIIKAFTVEKHNFIEYDPFKDELKRRMNMVIVGEEWKKINDYDYSISNYGRVRNDKSNKIKAPRYHRWRYQVDLYKDSKRVTLDIKKLVAHFFIQELQKGDEVRYIDGDCRNNYYKNLKVISKGVA